MPWFLEIIAKVTFFQEPMSNSLFYILPLFSLLLVHSPTPSFSFIYLSKHSLYILTIYILLTYSPSRYYSHNPNLSFTFSLILSFTFSLILSFTFYLSNSRVYILSLLFSRYILSNSPVYILHLFSFYSYIFHLIQCPPLNIF
jgi:hypothetical protein